jgi:hypothetical protein
MEKHGDLYGKLDGTAITLRHEFLSSSHARRWPPSGTHTHGGGKWKPHFAEGLEDGVVVDGGEVEAGVEEVQVALGELVQHRLLHLVLAVDLQLVGEEKVPVQLHERQQT